MASWAEHPWAGKQSEEEVLCQVTVQPMERPCHPTPNTKESASPATATPASGEPPVQEMFMTREYTPTELIDRAAKFPQKAQKGIQVWLVQLGDAGAPAFL